MSNSRRIPPRPTPAEIAAAPDEVVTFSVPDEQVNVWSAYEMKVEISLAHEALKVSWVQIASFQEQLTGMYEILLDGNSFLNEISASATSVDIPLATLITTEGAIHGVVQVRCHPKFASLPYRFSHDVTFAIENDVLTTKTVTESDPTDSEINIHAIDDINLNDHEEKPEELDPALLFDRSMTVRRSTLAAESQPSTESNKETDSADPTEPATVSEVTKEPVVEEEKGTDKSVREQVIELLANAPTIKQHLIELAVSEKDYDKCVLAISWPEDVIALYKDVTAVDVRVRVDSEITDITVDIGATNVIVPSTAAPCLIDWDFHLVDILITDLRTTDEVQRNLFAFTY